MESTRIEAAEKLSKLPGMENSQFELSCLFEYGEYDLEWLEICERGSRIRAGGDFRVFPWLRIEDKNPWSSAAILARAGYIVRPFGKYREFSLSGNGKAFDLKFYNTEYQETANILGICKLYEIDRKAYDKGMELLLTEHTQGKESDESKQN